MTPGDNRIAEKAVTFKEREKNEIGESITECRRVKCSSTNQTSFYRVQTSMEKIFITAKKK